MVTEIERLFPGLIGKSYQFTSPSDEVYNCIAWAATRTSEWWWPTDVPGNYWPPGGLRDETVPAFQDAFATLEYSTCTDAGLESGFEKIAIFADDHGFPTHASRQLQNGRWTSKIGKLEDIEHDLLDLVGTDYGSVVVIMRRPLP
jgi:hypothetical protein